MTLQQYAGLQVNRLIARVAEEAGHLADETDPDAIHDLRVAVRRLTQALRSFSKVLGKKEARQVRGELKVLMDLAGEVRTRDIALELFEAAGAARQSPPCLRLASERADAIRALAAHAASWKSDGAAGRWRQRLNLE